MLRIAIVRSAQGLETLRSAWESLYRAGHYSIFQSPEWNLLAARVFATAEPMVIHAEGDGGSAIIPACITEGRLCFLGDALFDYQDALFAGDDHVLRRAWQHAAVAHAPLSITALRGERTRAVWQALGFSPSPFCNAPGLRRVDVPPDDFSARHTRSGRLLRRLARAGVELRIYSGSSTALVRHIYELKAQQLQTTPGNLFADCRRIEFMVTIAASDARCDIFTLETAGTLVAALVTFRDGQTRRFYTVYYDHAWAHYSPGIALLFEASRRSLEQGLDCDYLTGEKPHKTRFATYLAPLFRVEAPAHELARIGRALPAVAGEPAPVPLAA